MTWYRRPLMAICAAVLLLIGALSLFGCSSQVAATWNHGQIAEEDVTTTIENMRSTYGLTDDESWRSFVEGRSYDTDAASDQETGTAADLRTYVIDQMARQDIIDYEIENQDIQVSDEELDAYVEQQRQAVESQYMDGVFESWLEQQGYTGVDEFREQARETLAEQKLRQQATGSEDDEDAWNSYVDGLFANANLTINEMPSGLSYDLTADSGSGSSEEEDAGE